MEKTPDISPELLEFRRRIDALDDKIISLLIERTGIVAKVGEMKRRNHPGQCPIRAGREADMVRRVIDKFRGSHFPLGAAAAIWRTLIGASTSIEGQLNISVYTPDKNNDLYWMAREYFGPFIAISKQAHVKRVIGDVIDGKCAVGIVPVVRSSDTTYWWTNLIQQGSDTPKIFAHVPFVYYGAPGNDAPAALAISCIAPEATGDDVSLIVLEAEHNVSQNKLQTAFGSAKLEAAWLNVATLHSTRRHHLIELKGFITPTHDKMKAVLSALGTSVLATHFLGAYAKPLTLENDAARSKK